jgi:transposase
MHVLLSFIFHKEIIMNKTNETRFTAYVGIDWADKKHDICLQEANSIEREFSVLPHKVALIDEWAQSLYLRFGGPIAVAVELQKGPIVYALQKYDFLVIHTIPPSTLAGYRNTFTPSRAKDDPTDAACALELLTQFPERFKPIQLQSVEIRTLASLVEKRRVFVDESKRITNRLRATLKHYYPQALDWFDHINTFIFCDFITNWPTLNKVKRARKNTLKKFFNSHNVRVELLIERRRNAIKGAVPLTDDSAVIIPNSLQAINLCEQLRTILEAIHQFDKAIEALAAMHKDYPLFGGLPGAGPILAPRLLVAFGEDRELYQTAADLQKYSGIAPVTERSGKKHWVHWRWKCSSFLRQTFVEWAAQTINKSFWAGEFYRQQREKGSSYNAAVRALAFKWIRILFRCWKSNRAYDESIYLRALERRGSPLVKQYAEAS